MITTVNLVESKKTYIKHNYNPEHCQDISKIYLATLPMVLVPR